ncbi:MAG: hypothetical protein R3C02_09140 [Planctomycetaceae bacterium]
MTVQIILVHGRGFKPQKPRYMRLWLDAITAGFQRDRPDLLPRLLNADISMVYYADLSAKWLCAIGQRPVENDLDMRQATLDGLKQLTRRQFGRSYYLKQRGHEHWLEGLADTLDHPISFMKLGEHLFELYAPEIREYWADVHFGGDVRFRLVQVLRKAMKREGPICLVGHSLGTLVCYDVLWKLSHYSEYRHESWNRRVDLLITLGAPLANETIRKNLKGANVPDEFRYPTNLRRWINIAAEDDIIAHDQTVANDFRLMKRSGCRIIDHRIYNPATRDGKPNPHEGTGYLIHPRTVQTLAKWLEVNS